MGDVAQTKAKYSGLLTGQIAVAKLRLTEAVATGAVASAAELREMIVELQDRLDKNREVYCARQS